MTGLWRRSPAPAMVAGAVIGAAACGAALLFGFGAPVALWIVTGALAGLIWWTVRHVIPAVDDIAVEEPQTPPDPWPTNVERRARLLEGQIRGAGDGRETTATALHETIAEIARGRGGDPASTPALTAYLSAAPHSVDRARLRMILRELTNL